MNTLSLKQIELANLIPHFNIQELEKLISFAKANNFENNKSSKRSLAGIWSDIQFDDNKLEKEIRELRDRLIENLNNKEL